MGPVAWLTPVRAVLDANVLVSALLFQKGRLAWLRDAWFSGVVAPMVSRETIAELVRVLAYPKFTLSGAEQHDLLDLYLPFCETVGITGPPPAVPACRDPADLPFLELALNGRADVLVTGDAALLELDEPFVIPILAPAEFREWLLRKAPDA